MGLAFGRLHLEVHTRTSHPQDGTSVRQVAAEWSGLGNHSYRAPTLHRKLEGFRPACSELTGGAGTTCGARAWVAHIRAWSLPASVLCRRATGRTIRHEALWVHQHADFITSSLVAALRTRRINRNYLSAVADPLAHQVANFAHRETPKQMKKS
jgi:hypothetical protein